MSWALDGKIRIHARLSNTSFMHLHSWASVSLRRLYIGQFLSLHFKNRDEDFLSKGSKNILHDNKMFSSTMELPNESVSLDVIFVLFCFHLRRVCDLMFSPKIPEKLLFIFIRGIQQATSISFFFFSFLGINEGIKRKHILHSLVADQSTGFLTRSRVLPQCINSREIGKMCRQKWKFQHQNHDDYDFLITYKREPHQRHD